MGGLLWGFLSVELRSSTLAYTTWGVGNKKGQEALFKISLCSNQCQSSHLGAGYLPHQRVPFCEGVKDWMGLNNQVENKSCLGPAYWLLSALSHPVQPMIPQNWCSRYTGSTHVSALRWKNSRSGNSEVKRSFESYFNDNRRFIFLVFNFPTVKIVHAHADSEHVLSMHHDEDWQTTSESHLPCQSETRSLSFHPRLRWHFIKGLFLVVHLIQPHSRPPCTVPSDED